jgi:hypothetical protein
VHSKKIDFNLCHCIADAEFYDVSLVQLHSERMDLNSCHCILQFIKPTVQVAGFGTTSTVQKPTSRQEKTRWHKGCCRETLRYKE